VATQQYDLRLRRSRRRVGYGVSVFVNAAGLVVVHNILEWGFVPFLTADFERLVPWLSLLFTAVIVANAAYWIIDEPILKATGQIGLNLISVFVTYQVYRVFPFDFGAYLFDWGVVTRVVLVLAVVGAGIGVVTEAMRLASGGRTRHEEVVDVHGT
jgi:hypothetical protein